MGHGIATSIARAGWPLKYLDHPGNQPTDDLAALGAAKVSDRQELARQSDVVILCVTGTPQIEEILLSEGDGVLAALKPGTVIIDCSTAVPSSTKNIAAQVEEQGGRFLDAPMTRTPKEAAEGRLNLIVGGDQATFKEMRPLLDSYAENVFYAGPVTAGHKLKLLHNFVSLGFAAVVGEAAACAERAGIDSEAFLDVLSQGAGGGVVFDRMAPYIRAEDYSHFDFTVANAHKDMSYYNQMASDVGAAHVTAAGVLEAYSHLVDAGHADSKIPEQVKWLQGG
jgi:3-hydroxyisobutyrate dehydrogenase